MIGRVLVPVDDSEMAERVLRYALEAFPDSTIVVYHVVGEPSPMMGEAVSVALEDEIQKVGEERAKEIFDRTRAVAADYEAEIDTEVGYGNPAKAILEKSENFDTVVIGTHGGSLVDRLFVGNVAEKVFRRSPVPVVIVR